MQRGIVTCTHTHTPTLCARTHARKHTPTHTHMRVCIYTQHVGTTHQYTQYYITDEDWRHVRVATDMTTSLLHILKPVGVELTIQRKRSILQQDAFLPRWEVLSL